MLPAGAAVVLGTSREIITEAHLARYFRIQAQVPLEAGTRRAAGAAACAAAGARSPATAVMRCQRACVVRRNPKGRPVLIFGRACWRHGIEHRLTKPNRPRTSSQAERVNRTVKEATVRCFQYDSPDQLRGHLEQRIRNVMTPVPERDGPFVQSDWLGKEV